MTQIKQMSYGERLCRDNPEDKFGRNFQILKKSLSYKKKFNSSDRHTMHETLDALDIDLSDRSWALLRSFYNLSKRLSEADSIPAGLIPHMEVESRVRKVTPGNRKLWRRTLNPLIRSGYIIQISDDYYALNPDYMIYRWFYSKESQDYMYNQFYHVPPKSVFDLGIKKSSIDCLEILWDMKVIHQGTVSKTNLSDALGINWRRRVSTMEESGSVTKLDMDLWRIDDRYIVFKLGNK